MQKDLENVIITFWMVALVFAGGSLVYQKKLEEEYILVAEQSRLEAIRTGEFVKAERVRIQEEKNLLAEQEKLRNEQLERERLAIIRTRSKNAIDQALAKQNAAELARQQAQIVVQQQAQSQVAAPKAPAPKPAVTKTSRKSRAS